MTANTLYSDFIDRADVSGNIKNNRDNLAYISALAGGIVRYDLWNEVKDYAIYPFIGNNATSHSINFCNTNFTLTYPNGMTHSELGMQPNGINQYANTFMSVSPAMYNSGHLSVYSTTNVSLNDSRDMGANNSTLNFQLCAIRGFNGQGFSSIGNNTIFAGSGLTNYNAKGIYISNRNSPTSLSFWRNSIKLSERTESFTYTSGATTNPIIIGGTTNGGSFVTFSNRTYGLASIGLGLTDSKAEKYSNLIRYIQGIKNRQ